MDRKKIIKRLWALGNNLYGKDKDKQVYGAIGFLYEKERLRELTDDELSELVRFFAQEISKKEVPQAEKEWRLIKVLQKQIGWSDEHLENYIKKHAHVSNHRFLDARGARAVVAGMKKIQDSRFKIQKSGVR